MRPSQPDAQTPQFLVVVCQVVGDALTMARVDNLPCALGEIAFKTAAGQHTVKIAVAINQHLRARLAVGGPFCFEHHRKHHWLAVGAPSLEALQQLTGRHAATRG